MFVLELRKGGPLKVILGRTSFQIKLNSIQVGYPANRENHRFSDDTKSRFSMDFQGFGGFFQNPLQHRPCLEFLLEKHFWEGESQLLGGRMINFMSKRGLKSKNHRLYTIKSSENPSILEV